MQGLFGWIGNHSTGLFAEEQEAIEDADAPGEKAVEDQYIHGPGQAGALLCLASTSTLPAVALEMPDG